MEDCCAVCAETLEWIAYGSCGHQEVCSTCVVRLRFILGDRCCCICKTDCTTVFVTRALGSFTDVKLDFSEFPLGVGEGQHGQYWYHEDSQAYFNDVDHYRMIKAMCKLSCNICDNNTADQRRDGSSRRNNFRNIEQLKGHLYHQHKMFMCTLCLEGRKVFISEQKLYNRSQLRQHINSGDSEVDGSEIERGGFIGHPICDFCKVPFYGDNELYVHMSTEHYTCHICQRQHPGQYVYYGNYDDLETHFRHDHFLCEDEACLTKKFIVFQSEAEMKRRTALRHTAIEHGGHMSRSKRNAALQIPVSFRYRQSTEYDQRRGRGRGFRREPNQLTIQASIENAIAEGRANESSSAYVRVNNAHGETNQYDSITSSMESLSMSAHPEELSARFDGTNSQNFGSVPIVEDISFPPLSNYEPPETSSRYAQALNQGSSARLGEASFPPLPGAKDVIKPKISSVSEGLTGNTIAARLSKGSVKVLHSAQLKTRKVSEPSSSVNSSVKPPTQNHGSITSSSHPLPSGTTNLVAQPLISANSQAPPVRGNDFAASIPVNTVWNTNKLNKVRHSASAPNLSSSGHSNPSNMNKEFAVGVDSIQPVENDRTANKSLVQSILAGLGMDEEKYAAFKTISTDYRQGEINTMEYLSYVEQFGLSHLVLELARMCPDTQKRKELIDAYNANLCNNGLKEDSNKAVNLNKNGKKGKGKGRAVDHAASTSAKDALADNILEQVRKLQTNQLPWKDDLEVLSKDGYRTSKDQVPLAKEHTVLSDDSSSKTIVSKSTGGETSKKNRKAKFQRLHLADGSNSAFPDLSNEHSNSERSSTEHGGNHSGRVPIRGVWSNGGGQRLLSHNGSSK